MDTAQPMYVRIEKARATSSGYEGGRRGEGGGREKGGGREGGREENTYVPAQMTEIRCVHAGHTGQDIRMTHWIGPTGVH